MGASTLCNFFAKKLLTFGSRRGIIISGRSARLRGSYFNTLKRKKKTPCGVFFLLVYVFAIGDCPLRAVQPLAAERVFEVIAEYDFLFSCLYVVDTEFCHGGDPLSLLYLYYSTCFWKSQAFFEKKFIFFYSFFCQGLDYSSPWSCWRIWPTSHMNIKKLLSFLEK